jgi:hypothetical protein
MLLSFASLHLAPPPSAAQSHHAKALDLLARGWPPHAVLPPLSSALATRAAPSGAAAAASSSDLGSAHDGEHVNEPHTALQAALQVRV